MNIGQYDIANTSGVFISEPRLLSTVLQAETEYPHVYGRPPDYMTVRFTCVTTDSSWLPGESWYYNKDSGGSPDGLNLVASAGKLILAWQGSNGGNILLPSRTGSGAGIITTTSWRFEVIAVWFPRT